MNCSACRAIKVTPSTLLLSMGLFSFFSPHAHPFERRVNRFFVSIRSNSNPIRVQQELRALMQENLVVLNLWMEKKYKNYVYLKKRVRRQLYANAEQLKAAFLQFEQAQPIDPSTIPSKLPQGQDDWPSDLPGQERLLHLAQIMAFLRPGRHYEYQASANFGKLLKDPSREKLIGDCNQIVTLYVALYALKFPIEDLQINLLPGHVCLHFRGIDIEATNATFHHYTENVQLLPITELISTNLLDVNDAEAATRSIDPRTMVKRAQLAEHVSSFKSLVSRNLTSAYQHLIVALLKEKSYDSALFFAHTLKDPDWIRRANESAIVDAINRQDFSRAERFLKHGGDARLWETFYQHRGVWAYKEKRYKAALEDFRHLGHEEMVRACYQGLYSQQVHKVRHVKTVAQAKRYRSVYRELVTLARQAGNAEAEAWAADLLKKTAS